MITQPGTMFSHLPARRFEAMGLELYDSARAAHKESATEETVGFCLIISWSNVGDISSDWRRARIFSHLFFFFFLVSIVNDDGVVGFVQEPGMDLTTGIRDLPLLPPIWYT